MRAVWQLQLNLLELYSCAPYGSYPAVAFTRDHALVASRECTFYIWNFLQKSLQKVCKKVCKLNGSGTTRFRFAGGWVSKTSGQGDICFESIGPPVAEQGGAAASSGPCVYLHCRAGHGRTGLIAAVVLGVAYPEMPMSIG